MRVIGIFFVAFLVSVAFVDTVFAADLQKSNTQSDIVSSSSREYVADEVLVKYKSNVINLKTVAGKRSAADFALAQSLEKTEDIPKNNMSVLTITDSVSVAQKVAELQSDPRVEYAQPNFQYYPSTISTDDTYRGLLWGMDNTGQTVGGAYSTHNPGTTTADMDMPEAWSFSESTSSAPVIVAVIDTGVAYNHPDLALNMWDGTNCKSETGTALGGCVHGYDFQDNDKNPLPTENSHGTHVAGTIAAVKNNAKGVIGVAPHAYIMAIKSSLTTANIIKGIQFASQNGAKVINASWAGTNNDLALKSAIQSYTGLLVAAASNEGNDNDAIHYYPSDYDLDNIISVAATDQADALASFSNYGATSVDVGAPGVNIYSTISTESSVLNETFEDETVPSVPAGFILGGVANNWQTVNLGGTLGKVLSADTQLPYTNTASTSITSPTYDMSGGEGVLSFWTQCDTEYSTSSWLDYMALDYSGDGGNTFTEITKWDEAQIDEYTGDMSATNEASTTRTYSISSQYATNNFKFRFRWVTNGTDNNYTGCVINNIVITKFSDGSDEQYGYKNGTSMAAPHVTGLAALIESWNPSLTVAQVKNAILSSGNATTSLSGKTVSGKRVNAYNTLTSINFAKAITSFTIPTQTGSTTINESAHSISISVPSGTDVTTLTPTIAITGVSISPASGVVQNFTNPVTYTVTAADTSTQSYTVTITTPPATTTIQTTTVTTTTHKSSGGGGGGGGGGNKPSSKYSVLINKNTPYATTTKVVLTIAPVKDATFMQVAHTADFVGAEWVPFKSTYSWTLKNGLGTKMVYVRYGKNDTKHTVLGKAQDSIMLVDKIPKTTPLTVSEKKTPVPYIFTTELKKDAKGTAVTALQNRLIASGYLKLKSPTGVYDEKTVAAVKKYQKEHTLKVTGILDTKTRKVLNTQ